MRAIQDCFKTIPPPALRRKSEGLLSRSSHFSLPVPHHFQVHLIPHSSKQFHDYETHKCGLGWDGTESAIRRNRDKTRIGPLLHLVRPTRMREEAASSYDRKILWEVCWGRTHSSHRTTLPIAVPIARMSGLFCFVGSLRDQAGPGSRLQTNMGVSGSEEKNTKGAREDMTIEARARRKKSISEVWEQRDTFSRIGRVRGMPTEQRGAQRRRRWWELKS